MALNSRLFNNYFPAFIWLAYHLAITSWRFNFYGALMFTWVAVVFVCLLRRSIPIQRAPLWQCIVAWVSTILPTLMVWQPSFSLMGAIGKTLSIIGILGFILSCIELDRSFGISPAKRAFVSTGIYRYIKNPMYWSHMMVGLGVLLCVFNLQNILVFTLGGFLFVLRSYFEKQQQQPALPQAGS